MTGAGGTVGVVGGAMAGLAAAEAFHDAGFDVDLYERQSYDAKRVNCGEAMTAVSEIPLDPTPENGFHNPLPALEVEVYDGTASDRRRTGRGEFPAADAYITDRNAVERAWADRLDRLGVAVHEDHPVPSADFLEFADGYDLVVDATGHPSLSSKALGRTDAYGARLVALNADVAGDFGDLHPNARIVLENYTGYVWAFPKTPRRANLGIGWTFDERPDDYFAAFAAACDRNGWPVPSRDRTNVATIPEGPNLDPDRTYLPEHSVVRVGDAAGIANRVTGKGISQAVESSYLAAELAAAGRLEAYPGRLYRRLKPEFLFASVVRHLLEARRPRVLGAAVRAASGVDIEAVDRAPTTVLRRLARNPLLLARIFLRRRALGRLYAGMTDRWRATGAGRGSG
ncbi:NAD(P)/FAD-dependent oxidoreductase [Halobellus ruber]|nr:NAD(P)/FAD-dependent oxidoreductase [Halobellus ruber]